MPAEFDDSSNSRSNSRKKSISSNQAELLHDLFCVFVSELNSNQANALIKIFVQKNKNPFTLSSCNFDDDTLEENK